MNSAVRNGPMRTVEMNTASTAIVIATLPPISAHQPSTVCGGCQFQVASAISANTAVAARIDHQLISRGSAPASLARVISSVTTRQQAAASANAMPASASAAGMRADHQRQPEKRGDARRARRAARAAPAPVAAAASPVSSG